MPKIDMSVPHSLTQEEAKKRISHLIEDSKTRFAGKVNNVSESWSGYVDSFSFEAMGFSVSGKLDVQPAQVRILIELPWAAAMLKGRIESEIRNQAQQLLG